MPRLRDMVVAEFQNRLDNSYFGSAAFDVTYPDQGDTVCLIRFSSRPSWYWTIKQDKSSSLYVACSPGVFKTHDSVAMDRSEHFMSSLVSWCDRVREELRHVLRADPVFEEFRKSLDDAARDKKDANEPFSAEEIDALTDKLSALGERLAELEAKHQITAQELEKLQRIIASAKEDLATYPKATWVRVTASRLFSGAKAVLTSPEARRILTEKAREMLHLPAPPA